MVMTQKIVEYKVHKYCHDCEQEKVRPIYCEGELECHGLLTRQSVGFSKEEMEMQRYGIHCFLFVLLCGITVNAGATVLTFDDVYTDDAYENCHDSGCLIPSGYGGFQWEQFGVIREDMYPDSGYEYGVVSGRYAAFNTWERLATLENGVFDFQGAYLTAAWRDDVTVTVTGFLDGVESYSRMVSLSRTSPTWFDFNFTGIDELHFLSSLTFGENRHFVMDDFTFEVQQIVPEPSTFVFFSLGLVGVWYLRKRRR